MVTPIFFLIFFGIINGGTLLYSRNALQHAADVGAVQIATLGNATNVDIGNAIPAMEAAGMNNVMLTTITGVTVQKEDASGSSSGETLTPDTSGCGGSPCEQQYTESGGVWTCTGICTWPSQNRDTSQSSGLAGDPDFARLTIYYTFALVGGFATYHMSASVVFRLEPQTL